MIHQGAYYMEMVIKIIKIIKTIKVQKENAQFFMTSFKDFGFGSGKSVTGSQEESGNDESNSDYNADTEEGTGNDIPNIYEDEDQDNSSGEYDNGDFEDSGGFSSTTDDGTTEFDDFFSVL